MARNDPQVNIRLPSALKEKLDQLAQKNGRSLTAEIVKRLEDSETNEALLARLASYERLTQDLLEDIHGSRFRSVRIVKILASVADLNKLKRDDKDLVEMVLGNISRMTDSYESNPRLRDYLNMFRSEIDGHSVVSSELEDVTGGDVFKKK